jgi:CheY-like chemotaxis protein
MSKSIFVVDDNVLTRTLVCDALRASGYEPVPYPSASVALEALRTATPVACVTDHLMPGMSGADFVKALRSSPDERLRSLPIIGLTARFGEELLAAGATTCLAKPFSEEKLAAALDAALSSAPRAAEGGEASPRRSLSAFRALHERARAGRLDGSDLRLYREMRADLAQAFLAMQHVALPQRSRARRALRVVMHLRLELFLGVGSEPVRVTTVDIGQGGFSAVVPLAPAMGAKLRFRVQLSDVEWLEGLARVANVTPVGEAGHRVGFSFVNLALEAVDRLEMRVFDAVVLQLDPPAR